MRPGDRVEPEIPRREPRVLPRIRHREHVEAVEMAPAAVAAMPAGLGRRRLAGVPVQPAAHVIGVDLLAPDEPGARLAQDLHLLRCCPGRRERAVELVGVRFPRGDRFVERASGPVGLRRCIRAVGAVEPQPQLGLAARGHRHAIAKRRLGAVPVRVDGGRAGDDVVVDAVLRVRGRRVRPEDARCVRLVLAEERLRQRTVGAGCCFEPVAGELVVGDHERGAVAHDARAHCLVAPRPRVAEPERRQHLQCRLLGRVVLDDDAGEDLGGRGLRVGDVDRPVAVVVERAGIEQLELGIPKAAAVTDEYVVGKRGLRVVVAPAKQRVARQPLEVPPVLLDVLAVVSLRPGEAEHPLLQDRILAVPEREREAELVADVRDAGHPVLVPAVGAGARVIVRERVPGIAALGVVLADGAPGALAQIRAPLVPRVRREQIVLGAAGRLGEPSVFGRRRRAGSRHVSPPGRRVGSRRRGAMTRDRAQRTARREGRRRSARSPRRSRRRRATTSDRGRRPTAARRGLTRARHRGSRPRPCGPGRRASTRRRGSATCRFRPSRVARRAATRRRGRRRHRAR